MKFIRLYVVLFLSLLSFQNYAQIEKDSIIISKELIRITFTNKMKIADLEKIKQGLFEIGVQLTYFYYEFDENEYLKRIYARIVYEDKISDSIYMYEITDENSMRIGKGKITDDNNLSKSNNKTRIKKYDIGPIYPGCEKKKTEIKRFECFNNKILKYVKKNFNNSIARQLNLRPGIKKIYIMFTIDKNGNIFQIRSRASHILLEKEAIRVVGSLPTIIPAKLNGKSKSALFSLPVTIMVQ